MSAPPRHPACEHGAVLLEVALVVPLLLLLVLGALDMGLWVFETTQAASGARDGARVGMLSYAQADVAGSDDAVAVRQAVEKRLGVRTLSVDVQCVDPGDTTPLPGGCADANLTIPSRIDVRVSWQRTPLSFVTEPFGVTRVVSSRAQMSISGRPPGVGFP